MHSTSSAILFTTLAVFTSSAAAASRSQAFQQQSTLVTPTLDTPNTIYVHDIAGHVTLNFHSPPLPVPHLVEMSNARPGSQAIASVFVALFIYRLLRVVSHQLSKYIILTLTHKHTRRGCKAAVSDCERPPVTTSIKRHAHSLGEVDDLRPVTLPQEPSLTMGSALPGHLLRLDTLPKSDSLSNAGPSIEATSSAHDYGPCIYHRRGRASTQTRESIIQPNASVCRCYPGIHQAITGGSFPSKNIESPSPDGDELSPSSRSSTGHALANNNAFPSSNFVSLATARSILALSILVVGLVVGLDWAHNRDWALPGVAHDIEWFKRICSGLGPFVTLQTLTDATHDIIRSSIVDMFKNARLGTAIVLYFSGHGLNNSFLLYNGTRVDAVTLIEWITEIRKETGKHLSVCMVLDHCRFESRVPLLVDLGQDIHILWACMPGQRSADFRMASDEDAHIPCSNTLKVFSLVLDEARSHPSDFIDGLMLRMNAWMNVVVHMMRAEECRMSGCPTPCFLCSCPSYESCTHSDTRSRHWNPLAYPRAQNPNGMFSGFEVGVCASQLLALIEPAAGALLDRMQETAERIKSHKTYQATDNTAAPPNGSNRFQPARLRVRRGRNTDAAAVPTQPLPI